jgi:hypothetical protein
MDQAMAVLRALVHDIRLPGDGLRTEKRKMSSLFLTYSDENQQELTRLVEVFKAKARQLGVDVNLTDTQDL